jgi:hypothetical protein
MPALTTDQMLSRANALANQIAAARVPEEQLAMALVHVRRHRDVAATLILLGELRQSSFARRSRSTSEQLRNLEESVRRALLGLNAWEDAAMVLGWARRLVGYYTRK